MLVKVDDHVPEAIALLPQQFKDTPAMVALLSALIAPLNSGEADLFDLLLKRMIIDAAEGVQLDALGATMGALRQGQSDADFRIAITKEIAIQLSNGTANDLFLICDGGISITDNQAGQVAEFSSDITTFYDGDNQIEVTDAYARVIHDRINRARAAGVYFTLEWFSADVESTPPGGWFFMDWSPMDSVEYILKRAALGAVDNPE